MQRRAPAVVDVVFVVGCLTISLAVFHVRADANIRSLFTRHADKRLSSLNAGYHDNTTVDACAVDCNAETSFTCKSFSFDNAKRACLLYTVNLNDRDVRLLDATDVDHYETAYVQQFQRLPKHRFPSSIASRLPVDGVSSVEDCARRCTLLSADRCCGFNFRQQPTSTTCSLVSGSCASISAVRSDDTDLYQRQPGGALANFINYGAGILRPRDSVNLYQKVVLGVPLEQCARQCLNESTFRCSSFDYMFAVTSECRLSHFIAASVGGLVVDTTQPRHSHYELADKYLSQFYAVPYSLIPGHNVKTYQGVSPERCAELCIREKGIVCRSFDYQVQSGSECSLSEKTGHDIGGLDTATGLQDSVHHFEMKPLLECGGNLVFDSGDLASPNWPRNYAHHQNCVWNITVSRHKIIKLEFTHLSLVGQTTSSSAPCSDKDDRLVIEEPSSGVKSYCVSASSKMIVTKSNQMTVRFITNGLGDAQGFRAYYNADWPCDVYLQEAPGEIASPRWPEHYPTSMRCTWRLTAPVGQRVRILFTDFNLDRHVLGHCNERVDHVRLLDGGTTSAPQIGLYCGRPFGTQRPMVALSTSRDMLLQFQSDRHSTDTPSSSPPADGSYITDGGSLNQPNGEGDKWWRQGFHAVFNFEPTNGTVFDDDGGLIDSSRYIDLGGGRRDVPNSDLEGRESHADNAKSTSLELSHPGVDATEAPDGRSGMWAAIALLLVLLIITGVALFLVVHHHRQRLIGQGEDVIEEQQAHVLEDIPLRTVHSVPVAVSSRRSQVFNNIVELSGPSTSCQVDCSTASAASTSCGSPIYEQCGPPPGDPRPVPRPRSSYGRLKYHADNIKNINVDNSEGCSGCSNV